MADHDNETFIDADSGFQNEKETFENIITKQILECTKVLSRDMTPNPTTAKSGHSILERPPEDVNELVINHVDTLRMLLCTYTEKHKKELETIDTEIINFEKSIKSRKINVPGKGPMPLGEIKGLNMDNVHWREFIDYKAKRHRNIFQVLILCYQENKAYIKGLEEE